jgi:hypothetical protein
MDWHLPSDPMTENDWTNSTDPQAMLAFLQGSGRASERKLRLFAVACCRRIWHLLVHEISRDAVVVGERFADGLATEGERDEVCQAADDVWALLPHAFDEDLLEDDPSFANAISAAGIPPYAAEEAAEAPVAAVEDSADNLAAHRPAAKATGWANATGEEPDAQAEALEQAAQARLVRCIFGNPFRPPPIIDPAWLLCNNGAVKRLAQAAYEERSLPAGTLDVARLAVLADALTDAGCTELALLEHLREPQSHVRGCWVVDLCLGRQ